MKIMGCIHKVIQMIIPTTFESLFDGIEGGGSYHAGVEGVNRGTQM